MVGLCDKLKEYLETTSREEVLRTWAETKEFDQVGPTMDDFLSYTYRQFRVQSKYPLTGFEFSEFEFSPKFSSGFFLQ
jgi:hypothetical protein